MRLRSAIEKVRGRHEDFKKNPLTSGRATRALFRYLWINARMHLLDQEVDLVVLDDIRCRVRKGDGVSGNYFFHLYEYQDSLFVLHYLRSGDCFVDVGANVGHYSLIAARKCEANVIAVEPVPRTFGRLVANVELNGLGKAGAGRIATRNVGLSHSRGVLRFTTRFNVANRVTPGATPDSVEVEVLSLDELCAGGPVDLLKIDVEGFEKHVLEGSQEQLDMGHLGAIIVELNGSGRRYGIEDEEVIDLLKDRCYSPYRYDPFERELTPLEGANREGYNTIFIKDIEGARARVRSARMVPIVGQLAL